MARKKRIQVQMSEGAKLCAKLMRLSEKVNTLAGPKYDSANIRQYLNEARSLLGTAATTAGQLPETWRPGRAKRQMTQERLEKLRAKMAKLAEQISVAEGDVE